MNKKYTDIMIDIETLDTKPTAVILSIGAVAFDIETGETCPDPLYHVMDYNRQIEMGRTISVDTMLWWGKQNEEAQKEALSGGNNLVYILNKLIGFINQFTEDDCRVWAYSPSFDLEILKHAYGYKELPWKYTQERDVRTYVDGRLTSVFVASEDEASHLPVEDCLQQIKEVCLVYKGLRRLE